MNLVYSPVDGDTLDPDGLNGNLYDTTPAVSLYETSNGHIELGNFASGFRVQSHHIQPGETGLAGFAGQVFSADYYQDAWGQGQVYRPVAGACFTFRQRYDAGMAILFASLACSVWRQPGKITATGPAAWSDPPDVLVRMFHNDDPIPATTRPLPQSVFYDGTAYPVVDVSMAEARNTRHFNLFHPKYRGGSGLNSVLTTGWHSFGLAVYVAYNVEGSDTDDADDVKDLVLNGGGNDARPAAFYSAMHRLRCYVRNAGHVTLR